MEPLRMKKNGDGGLLITVCGLDGCGKTSMLRRMVSDLRRLGQDIVVTKQPTEEMRKSDIFRTFMDCADHGNYDYRTLSLLAAADRIQHGRNVIEPALRSGKTVVSDRYFYSCLANLHARGFEWDRWIYEISESVTEPDLAFFFDVPVETAVGRVRARPEEKDRYIDLDLQHKLREKYLEICRMNHGILISSEGTEDETYQRVFAALERKLAEK